MSDRRLVHAQTSGIWKLRLRRLFVGAALVVGGVALFRSSTAAAPWRSEVRAVASTAVSVARHAGLPQAASNGRLGEADGAVPDGTTVFDDGVPGVARLDPELLGALRRAATAARSQGITLVVNSGWRSPAYEDQLRRDAVAKYGSEAEAARWVATGTTSPHVTGHAVDLGPAAAMDWLSTNGAAYGLCRIYGNEPWHFELRPAAISEGCPPTYADPTHDPRMQG